MSEARAAAWTARRESPMLPPMVTPPDDDLPPALAMLSAGAGDLVADVGAGTGRFSRQLARTLPAARIVGVEPDADMRHAAEAAATGCPNLSFVIGRAEALPFPDASLALVTAATAAHRFDRPRFYAEAFRCLRAGGRLAILQNRLRWWDSPLLTACEDLLEEAVPGYRRDTFPDAGGRFVPIHLARELGGRDGAGDVQEHGFAWDRPLTEDAFTALTLSSGPARQAAAAIGEPAFAARLRGALDRWRKPSGEIWVPGITTLVLADKLVRSG